MHDHDRVVALAAERLDWALTDEETATLEAGLASCAACRSAAIAMSATAGRLGRVPAVAPPARVDQAIGRALSGRRRRFGTGGIMLAAALALAAAAGIVAGGGPDERVVPPDGDPVTLPSREPARRDDASPVPTVNVGEMATVVASDTLAIRAAPGATAAQTGRILVPGQRAVVIDGPRTAGDGDWFELVAGDLRGWVPATDAAGAPNLARVANGELAMAWADADGQWILMAVSPDGQETWRLSDPSVVDIRHLTWSPDGTMLAFTARTSNGSRDILVVLADGTGRRQVAVSGQAELWPNWDPSSGRLALTRFEPDRRAVMVADQSGERVVGEGNAPMWSPDGSRLAVLQARPEGDQRLIIMDADGGSSRELGIVPLQRVSWSPDGSRIAVRGAVGAGCRICVVDVASGTFESVSDGVDGVPVWATEGSQLLVGEASHGGGRLVRLGRGGEVIGVSLQGQAPAGAVWSPDSRSMAAIATRDGHREVALVPVGEGAVTWLAADGDVVAFACVR